MSDFRKDTPIPADIVNKALRDCGIVNVGKSTIREIVKVISLIEEKSGQKFIRMEMGVPGFPPDKIGTDAEIDALKKGVAAVYPVLEGLPELKNEASRFIKLFMDVDVNPECIVPTVGSMMGTFTAFMVSCRRDIKKDTTLFINPGFPVTIQQHHTLGLKYETFDVYDFRGAKLKDKIESYAKKGNISTIIYSNPNNPSWVCFTEEELKIIGDIANKYDIIIVEDLAYFGMDFRQDISKPGVPPYQPSVAKYTDNYILLISSSKIFSYAGQRIAIMAFENKLYNKSFPDLKRFYSSDIFGHAAIYGTIYAISAGTSHSAQIALAAMMKAANDGKFNFVEGVKEYGERARIMKKLFTENGFKIVYDKDIDKPIADGFYFTLSYPGMNSEELLEELLYYGISAISLSITGSERHEGLRACVSFTSLDQMPLLEERLKAFSKNNTPRA